MMQERAESLLRSVELDPDSWRASVAIPVLGIVALFAAAPLGAWAAAISGFVAVATYVAFVRQQKIDLAHQQLADDLARAADAVSPDQPERRRRLAHLSDRIADRLGADEAQRREIGMAVALRSIGHLGIPAAVVGEDRDRVAARRAALVAESVSGWSMLAAEDGRVSARTAEAATIIGVAERFDGLRMQGLGPLEALNLLGANSSADERRVLYALNDLLGATGI